MDEIAGVDVNRAVADLRQARGDQGVAELADQCVVGGIVLAVEW